MTKSFKVFAACTLIASASVSWAQSGKPVVIDGAQNPTTIPDGRAFSLLLLSLQQSKSESADAYQKRTAAVVSLIDLTYGQGQYLMAAVSQFSAAVASQEAQTVQIRSDPSQASALQIERDAMAVTIVTQLKQQLGPDGTQQLLTYVAQVVKPHVRIVVRAN